MLDEANSFHPNIKIIRQAGTSASFLDVFIENKNGILATSVYRKDSSEPYIVSFRSDRPRHVFNNIIDSALMRAIRYSSTLFAFNEERRLIKLILLYNGLVCRHLWSLIFCFVIFLCQLSIKIHLHSIQELFYKQATGNIYHIFDSQSE
jgi:hypothetical protein